MASTMKAKKKGLTRNQVAMVFVLLRVPDQGAISYGELMASLRRDVERAWKDAEFSFQVWSRCSLEAFVRGAFVRHFLTASTAAPIAANRPDAETKEIKVTRNDRTRRYLAKVPKRVFEKLDDLPFSNPLILLAGLAT